MKIFKALIVYNLINLVDSFGFKFHTFLGNTLDTQFELYNKTLYLNILKDLNGSSFANVSTWADRIKTNRKYSWTRELHYIDIDECGQVKNPVKYCERGCILKSLDYLSHHNYANLSTFENLALLLHLSQDLFQPLHSCGFFRGGNDKQFVLKRRSLNTKGRKINFHQLFDSFLPEYFLKLQLPYNYDTTVNINITEILQTNVNLCCKMDWDKNELYLEDFYNSMDGSNYYNTLLNNYLKLSISLFSVKFNEQSKNSVKFIEQSKNRQCWQ